jgi:tRNA-modifying protein YgfZ
MVTDGFEGLEALREGRAAVDLSSWRKLRVRGADARDWLNDLISADIADLQPGQARRSLLLTPTGRIRADFTVTPLEDGFLLIQDSEQPEPLLTLLDPYVLSSDVILEDRTRDHALLALPSGQQLRVAGSRTWRPSSIGLASDVLAESELSEELRSALPTLELAGLEALEAWRIERGEPRFGVDLLNDSLPHEAGWEDLIGYRKGCFLGQEAVAKVRNLGHPPHVVLAATADGEVGAGDVVIADGAETGLVTSATPISDGRMAVIVRVRWAVRQAALRTPAGAEIRTRTPASPGPA